MSKNQKIIQRNPELRIEFLKWGSNEQITAISSNNVISYSYRAELGTLSAPFSVSMHINTPVRTKHGRKLLYQMLEPACIVKFLKASKGRWRAQYIGLIQSIDTNIAVSGGSGDAQIDTRFLVSGIAITGILDYRMNFSLSRIGLAANAVNKNVDQVLKKFSVEITKGTSIKPTVDTLRDRWLDLYEAMCADKKQSEDYGMRAVVNDYISTDGIQGKHFFPKLLEATEGTYSFSQMIEWITNYPFNLFYAVIKDGKYELTLKDRPLVPEKWAKLAKSFMSNIHIRSLNLHRTSNDAVSIVNVTIPQAIGGTQYNQFYGVVPEPGTGGAGESPILVNPAAMRRFGFRELMAEVRFIDASQSKDGEIEGRIQAAKDLYAMFEHNHEFYSGQLVTEDDYSFDHAIGQCMEIGNITDYWHGEELHKKGTHSAYFFVEGITYTGGYGVSPTATYQLTRGAVYFNSSGKFAFPIYAQAEAGRGRFVRTDQ